MVSSVECCETAGPVLEAVGGILEADAVRNNLLLTLLHQRVAQPEAGRYWIVRAGPVCVGVVFQSPPTYPALFNVMSREAVLAAVDAIVTAGVRLPGFRAEAASAAVFAGLWTERAGCGAEPVQGQRLYELLQEPNPCDGPGALRQPLPEELDLVLEWGNGFCAAVGDLNGFSRDDIAQRMKAGRVWLWDHQGPKTLVMESQAVAGVARVQCVFTPEEFRGRGYAAAGVTALSAAILARGLRCVLYTDLANATANNLYRRIGYTSVEEALRYRFVYASTQ